MESESNAQTVASTTGNVVDKNYGCNESSVCENAKERSYQYQDGHVEDENCLKSAKASVYKSPWQALQAGPSNDSALVYIIPAEQQKRPRPTNSGSYKNFR